MRNSYVEWIELPYYRLPGFGKVDRYDPVVFNFPHGDSIIVDPVLAGHDYYAILRKQGIAFAGNDLNVYLEDPEGYKARARNRFAKEFGIKARPIDKEENYIKRCVGLPGDRIEMRDRQVYINDKALENPSEVQYNYYFRLKNQAQLQKVREELDLTELDFGNTGNQKNYGLLALTDGEYEKLMAMNVVDTIVLEDQSNLAGQLEIFPNSMMAPYNTWTPDNFGPIAIPADGWTYEINIETLPLYHRVIEVYEGNEVEVRDNQVYINGELATEYTFKQNYYWMMGDNRHNSADSRFWGFVPETHVVGKAVFTWFSKENALQHGSSDIRWNRMFRLVD
jgi:signal peptidase I